MPSLPHTIDHELDELIALAPALALDGPKGVGKSETAARRAAHSHCLDDARQRELAAAAPGFLALRPGTLLLDEWQCLPQVWDTVRRQVGHGAQPGRFLLTGSVTPLPGVDTHSGAGENPLAPHAPHGHS